MKITKIDIPVTNNNDGLDHIKMEKIGKIVLIAGKNGSGKTRILNKIFETINSKPTLSNVISFKSQIENEKQGLFSSERSLQLNIDERKITRQQTVLEQLDGNIRSYKSNVEHYTQQIKRLENLINWKQIETDELKDLYLSVRFVPKNLELHDSNTFAKNQIINYATNLNSVGVDNLSYGTFSKIQVIQDRWFNSTHPSSGASKYEKQSAIDDYEKLQNIIEIFLNTKIGRTINDEPTLFGFPLGQSNLSDGQKIILQFCLAIYSQESALKDLILILDEPENHLHPSVIIETIERIEKCVSNGQIWIATHSVPLLAHFDPSLVWYVENNKIQHAGKIPEKVLQSLLGNDDEIAKLQDFIGLPAQYATSRYAFESLFEPSAVQTGSDDPQSFQIRTDLLELSKSDKLRILDYGAGKGRLISNIVDLDESDQEKLIENIEYIAYDKFSFDKEQCENALIKAYGSSQKKYFNDFNILLSFYDKKSFDVIVMCNVLHEIDPKDWISLFQKDGIVSSLLKEDGILLLVEDHQIPVGEKAYQKGFLVLDTPQIKELFKISETQTRFTFTDQKGNGRLKAHQIPKECLIQIDEISRLTAIKSISTLAKTKILEIRNMPQNYVNGKLHGFWTQQFANAQLNLAELSVT